MDAIPILALGTGALGVFVIQAVWRWWNRPQLDVAFNPRLDGCKMPTLEQSGLVLRQAVYFSIKVTNRGGRTAERCRAFLAGIDYRKDDKGWWQPTEFCDSMPLSWAYRSESDATHGIEIPVGVSQLLNVFSETADAPLFLPRTAPLTMRAGAFERFKEPCQFRFKIFVVANDARIERYCLTLDWKGHFDADVVVCQDTSWP